MDSLFATSTYQALHLQLKQAGYDLHQVCLGRYVSLDDDVEIRDDASFWDEDILNRVVLHFWKEVELSDRRKFNEGVFDILGLSASEREEVYRAVVDLVGKRLSKARSLI